MDRKKTLSEFQQALLDASLEEFRDVPQEDAIAITPSPSFTEKADALVRKTKRTGWYYVNTTLKKAVLIAALIALLTVTVAATPLIREAIIDFFVQDHGNHFGITFDPEEAANAPYGVQTIMGPTYIPEGFELILENASIVGVSRYYQNSEGQMILFDQYPMPGDPTGDSWMGIDSEGVTTEFVIMGDYRVFVVHGQSNMFFWTDNEYLYSLSITNTYTDTEEIERVFDSIQPLPDAQFTVP